MADVYDALGLLSAPLRVRLLRLVEVEELGVGELARIVQAPQPTVSRHLKQLLEANWVERRREGTSNLFALAAPADEMRAGLWSVVKEATEGEHREDLLRMAAVMAAREVDSRAFFGRVAGRWAEVRRELFGDHFTLSALAAMLPPRSVVADLGCGSGEMLSVLAPMAGRLIGVDREPAMLAAARHRLEEYPHVDLREGSVEAPPLGEAEVDLVLFMLVLHHVDEPERAVVASASALSPGGRMVVLDMVKHDREDYRRSMGHAHLGFSREACQRWAVAAGLRLEMWQVLAPDPAASGPPLFVATLTRS